LKKLLKISALLASVVLASLLYSCNPEKEGGENEGIIEFDTKAIDQTHPLSGLAPGSATLKYKDDKFIMEMTTMGVFNTSIIGNITEKTMTQTLKFMDIKQYCTDNYDEIQKENDSYKLSIEETKETKKILGYKCYKLKVSMVDNPEIIFDAWYTKDLGMENCNSLTPYAQVKGVLLDYRAKKMGLEMRFLAKSVKHLAIQNDIFMIPENLKPVSKAEMTKFFSDLQ
jgi:hypothetical protein